MRKIFLDCGAHCGCSRRKFQSLHDDFEIFSFEPDGAFNNFSDGLINKAVWIEDGEATFYKFRMAGGSSLSKLRADKLQLKLFPYTTFTTQTFDIDRWIKEQFQPTDYIILKLDVEGAEYQIIPHMIKNGSMSYINEVYIEYHNHRVDVPYEVDAALNQQMIDMGIKLEKWDAMTAGICIGKNYGN